MQSVEDLESEIVDMYYNHLYSVEEIANRTGVSLNTVIDIVEELEFDE